MKITSVFLAICLLMPSLSAITVEEFIQLPDKEKIETFKRTFDGAYMGPPDTPSVEWNNPVDYIRLHTIALKSASPELRGEAVGASAFAVLGFAAARSGEEGFNEEFYENLPIEDTDAFQRALLSLLDDEDGGIRGVACVTLLMSSPPVPGLEDLLVTQAERDSSSGFQWVFKTEILERMVMMGYRSERFEQMVINLLPTESWRASKVLGRIQSEAALPVFLEALSSGEYTVDTLKALAGYGAKARAAIPMLEKIITETVPGKLFADNLSYNIVDLAKRVLKSIETDTPDPDFYPHYPRLPQPYPELWPLIPEIVNFSSAKVSGPAAGLPDEEGGSADVDTNDQIGSVGAALPSESTEATAPVSEESPADGGSRDAPKSGDGQRSWWRFVVTAGLLGGLLVFLLRLRQRNRTP
ncbi:MAG: hypothetical protein M2R46_00789 [Verrucomicrobia subdivision 3 bacterium]|nr:hypothetical protein [Limisphaerales bacterium]